MILHHFPVNAWIGLPRKVVTAERVDMLTLELNRYPNALDKEEYGDVGKNCGYLVSGLVMVFGGGVKLLRCAQWPPPAPNVPCIYCQVGLISIETTIGKLPTSSPCNGFKNHL